MENAKLIPGKCEITKIMRIRTNTAYANAYSCKYALFSGSLPLICALSCVAGMTVCC